MYKIEHGTAIASCIRLRDYLRSPRLTRCLVSRLFVLFYRYLHISATSPLVCSLFKAFLKVLTCVYFFTRTSTREPSACHMRVAGYLSLISTVCLHIKMASKKVTRLTSEEVLQLFRDVDSISSISILSVHTNCIRVRPGIVQSTKKHYFFIFIFILLTVGPCTSHHPLLARQWITHPHPHLGRVKMPVQPQLLP